MWNCPQCSAWFQNPETHWKHLQDNPNCLEKTKNPGWRGWQGMKLDGVPTIIHKPGSDVPPHLWWKPKSPEEQADFRMRWLATEATGSADQKVP